MRKREKFRTAGSCLGLCSGFDGFPIPVTENLGMSGPIRDSCSLDDPT
jgi:hypothetical protein